MKKRKDGRYQLSVHAGFDTDGKEIRKVIYAKTQKELKEKADALKQQTMLGLNVNDSVTMAEWAKIWLETYKTGISHYTYDMYSSTLKRHILPFLGRYKVSDIRTVHIQEIINLKYKQGLTRTLKAIKITLSQIFNQAIANDIIFKNPCNGVILPKTETKEKRALTNEETSIIKSLDVSPRLRCFLDIALYTGMRKGEILALTTDDIDLKNRIIHVTKTVVFIKNKGEIKNSPKTKAGKRDIPICDALYKTIKPYVKAIAKTPHILLFHNADGDVISKQGFRKMWAEFTKYMGKTDITPHMFRHNFATVLFRAGVDVKMAQILLGHSSFSVTMDIYTHLGYHADSKSCDKINQYFNNYAETITL